MVDDIVVEFGNAFYQHTIDAFIAGQPVADADLRRVWRNTVVSPLETWDEPMYEQVYRTIRAANRALPAGKRMRVLLGDAPIDWSKITDFCQWLPIFQTRDQHFVSVVKKHVVAKGRRALLLKGLDAFVRPMAIEQVTGERVYAIVDLAFAASDPGGVGRQLAAVPSLHGDPGRRHLAGLSRRGAAVRRCRAPLAPVRRLFRDRDDAVTASRSASRSYLGAGTATRRAAPTAASPSKRSSMPACTSARPGS